MSSERVRSAGVSRRFVLRGGAVAVASFGLASGGGWLPGFLARVAHAQARPPAAPGAASASRRPTLVCVFQRGAADALSMLVPHVEPSYYAERPRLAIARPAAGRPDAALDLDGRFGLHPRLAPLAALYARRELAVVCAVGVPSASRSHFDAQHLLEAGTAELAAARDGVLDRALAALPAPPAAASSSATPSGAFRGVAFGATLPEWLRGSVPALAIDDLRRFGVAAGRPDVRARLTDAFAALYADPADPVARAGREALEAVRVVGALDPARYAPAHGAAYPGGPLGRQLAQLAQLIKADLGVEIAAVDAGGWDTHVAQGGASGGRLPALLTEFGGALAAFRQDLGDRMRDVVVVTVTEFGRTVAENGTGGTDHGHGAVSFVLGGGVRGGAVLGHWPGLDRAARFEGRDLAITTDVRDLLAELFEAHLGVRALGPVFPGYELRADARPGVLASPALRPAGP